MSLSFRMIPVFACLWFACQADSSRQSKVLSARPRLGTVTALPSAGQA